MKIRQLSEETTALGQAVNLLRRKKPFSSYPFGRFANVLTGQIRRRHYLFTFEENIPVGYVGWALCNEEAARAWIENRQVPSFAECCDGNCWVGITFYAESPKICQAQVRHLKKLYPGYKVFGIRDYGDREKRVVIDSKGQHLLQTAN